MWCKAFGKGFVDVSYLFLCIFITVYFYSLDGSVFFLILAVHAVLASSLGGLTSLLFLLPFFAAFLILYCCFCGYLLPCFPASQQLWMLAFNLWGCAVFVGPDNWNGTLEAQNLLLGGKPGSMFSLVFCPSASWPSDFFPKAVSLKGPRNCKSHTFSASFTPERANRKLFANTNMEATRNWAVTHTWLVLSWTLNRNPEVKTHR